MADTNASLLHHYRLRAQDTQRLLASSNQHERAFVRMHKDDVQAMSAGADSLRVMIVLFSTASAAEAVLIGTSDTVHVRLIKNGDSVPLRVVASHAYVRGMKISGVIHRAVLRVVRE
jgi:hypothetical protein